MANVNLKTDFKDGEFLYADQLKNNFEAIQAALAAMNAIVWQDNADKVVTFRGTTEELMNREIINGQILYDTNTGESYIDYLGKRISTGSGNAIHIGDTEPTNPSTQLWVDRDDLAGVGSEVVNSLEGNEERMAPSVAAVNKGLSKNIITARTIKDYTIQENDTYETIALYPLTNVGEQLTLENGTIKIGENISKVLVSFICLNEGQTAGRKYAQIFKNGGGYNPAFVYVPASTPSQIVQNPCLMDVSEGDIIELKVYGSAGDILTGNRTLVTVEAVN